MIHYSFVIENDSIEAYRINGQGKAEDFNGQITERIPVEGNILLDTEYSVYAVFTNSTGGLFRTSNSFGK